MCFIPLEGVPPLRICDFGLSSNQEPLILVQACSQCMGVLGLGGSSTKKCSRSQVVLSPNGSRPKVISVLNGSQMVILVLVVFDSKNRKPLKYGIKYT